ncbi:MAG TPA: hypothetical protein VIM56_17220, partial [Rhizomicrobium sp.]
MNKLLRGLLSGASLATLQLCAVSAARAAGTTISGVHGAITNPSGSNLDYILVSGATITGDLTNEGTINPGDGYGIDVANSTISGSIINAATGEIDVLGFVGIEINSNANVSGGIQNAGKILVSNTSETAGNESAKAIIYQAASVANVTNTGTMGVAVKVIGSDTDFAEARAAGVYEYVNSAAALNEAFAGTGGAIALNASAVSTSEEAEAEAYAESGVIQYAGNGTSVTQTITNTGTMSLIAKAKAVGSFDSASASAFAGDAYKQFAISVSGDVSQSITNSGAITLAASAHAKGSSSVKASAGAWDVFGQEAINVGGKVTQGITNSGTISAVVTAVAAATAGDDTKVKASADAGDIFYQYASSGTAITQSITNSGALVLSANAAATAASQSKMKVFAEIRNVFQQGAYSADIIDQSITNSGSLSLTAKATATAADETKVKANASVEDVFAQNAGRGGDVTQTITNSGSLSLSASAKAADGVSGLDLGATARVEDIFKQYAYTSGGSSDSFAQKITNSGNITITATASAVRGADTAFREADANLYVENLFGQGAYDATNTTQSITNSGAIGITGKATSVGGSSRAYAGAFLEGVFQQTADAVSAAQLSISNSGNLVAAMTAAATGYKADAQARAEEIFYQRASAEDKISESIANSGNLSIAMLAQAIGTNAEASAKLETGIKQEGRNASDISQSITNSGILTVDLTAKAHASSSSARAHAHGDGFKQYARGIDTIDQGVTNSGTLGFDFSAIAVRSGTNDHANATAKMFSAVNQSAFYSVSGSDTGKIAQAITNSGTLSVTLAAQAKGGDGAYAHASASQLFRQHATVAETISESVTNSGSVIVNAAAKASGSVGVNDAYAESGTVFEQYSNQNGDAGATASLAVLNKGTLSLAARATAAATLTHKAYARATNDAIARQGASNSGKTTETITNSGTIGILDTANATGGRAEVDAYSDGFAKQWASNIADATLSAVNAGSIIMRNLASAVGTQSADAFAGGGFVSQSLKRNDSEGDVQGKLSTTNSGTVDILASVTATAGGRIYARAEASGLKQYVRDLGADVAFNNSGTITLASVAAGTPGALGAGVTATTTRLPFIGAEALGYRVSAYGLSGVMSDNGSVHTSTDGAPLTLSVNNSGTLSVSATANGTAFVAANVVATATGIAVYASSKTGNIYNHTSNSASRHTEHTSYYGNGVIKGAIDNSGSLLVSATAEGGIAAANGVIVTANNIDADITNEKGGLISVAASGATAAAVGIALQAQASANHYKFTSVYATTSHNRLEVEQSTRTQIRGAAAKFDGSISNSGTIVVAATGTGANIGDGNLSSPAAISPIPSGSDIKAKAEGISVNAETMSGTIANAGTIDVTAIGPAAVANGIHVLASQAGSQKTYLDTYKWRGTATGYRWTSVSSTVPFKTAVLEGSKFAGTLSNSGTVSVVAKGSAAKATGVLIEDETYDGSFVNTGTISSVATGSGASAVGVRISASSLGSAASFANDGGSIIARVNGL